MQELKTGTELLKRDFIITKDALILSPSDFGFPQIRERVYILGVKRSGCNKRIQEQGYITKDDLNIKKYLKTCKIGDAFSILEEDVSDDYLISEEQLVYEEPKALTEILPDGSEKVWRKQIAFSVPYKEGALGMDYLNNDDTNNWMINTSGYYATGIKNYLTWNSRGIWTRSVGR